MKELLLPVLIAVASIAYSIRKERKVERETEGKRGRRITKVFKRFFEK